MLYLICNLTLFNNLVRGFNKTVRIYLCISSQRNYQSDIRPLRGLNRADPTVMGGMYITDFKACPISGQATWSQGRKPPLMGYLGERVGLIHELRKLRCAEKFLNCRGDRFGIHKVMGHKGLNFLETHTFLNGSFHAHQAHPVLIFTEFTNGTNTAVAEMVNIIPFL